MIKAYAPFPYEIDFELKNIKSDLSIKTLSDFVMK